jgi:DNA polymerase-3 subunit delta'
VSSPPAFDSSPPVFADSEGASQRGTSEERTERGGGSYRLFARLVGQDDAVATLRAAADAAAMVVRGQSAPAGAMTHAWLFTGPPGSGRSVAARAFAAALQCAEGGCGICQDCRQTLAGTHTDVRFVVPAGLSISVREMRDLVWRAAGAPVNGRWQVVLIEDADRLTEQASNALLKAIEEPSPRTVFLLCAPSIHPDDISVTIRSRCRTVVLGTPGAAAIAAMLTSEGHDPDTASWAAAAAQGHIGRARWLARDSSARERRAAVLSVPRRLTGVGACFDLARTLVDAAEAEAKATMSEVDAKEKAELEVALGGGGTGKGATAAARAGVAALKELEERQRTRHKRALRDALDRALVDLAGFYRDVLLRRVGAPGAPVHGDVAADVAAAAERFTPESTLRRLEAVLECRAAIDANVKPQIAVEAMMVALWRPEAVSPVLAALARASGP